MEDFRLFKTILRTNFTDAIMLYIFGFIFPLQNSAKQRNLLNRKFRKGKQPDTKVQQAVQQTLNLDAFGFVSFLILKL